MKLKFSLLLTVLLILAGNGVAQKVATPKSFSGIYPHLAYYNNEGECGTGAVVPWAGRLWVITYGPHLPFGSSDKLYEITPELQKIVRPESIGGTPANRMIHKESSQLFMGPYAIDKKRNVRVIPYKEMPGRHTGNARHLTDPANKIYFGTMEEGFYEVDVKTLNPTVLYEDINVIKKKSNDTEGNFKGTLLPGAHGKGFYSGQGVTVYSNNGEPSAEALKKFDIQSGVLAEWNGKDWKVIRRNQFTEVTGPGGIFGNQHPDTDPIWVNGWDHKSVLVGVRDNGKWSFYRLPKASHSYDGAHGWNTEWPRIRDIGTPESPDYMMTMHGMFWHFPGTFSSINSAGIRPGSAYLKVIGDFARWNNQLIFGCDDAAKSEFLNKRKVKGDIQGPGQSNSNIWFTSLETPWNLGPNTSEGAVWISENVKAGEVSEPFLFAGWDHRSVWVKNQGAQPVSYTFEVDKKGNNQWNTFLSFIVKADEAINIPFTEIGEWVRVKVEQATKTTVHFSYAGKELRTKVANPIFAGLAPLTASNTKAGYLWDLGENRRKLGILAGEASDTGFTETGYYELDSLMHLEQRSDPAMAKFIREKMTIPKDVVTIDDASVLIVDDAGRRWRLPKGNPKFASLMGSSLTRICREVATERDLLNCSGTFYELPAENADGFAKIRPISSHNFRIFDYTSYRGMLIMTGIDPQAAKGNPHIVTSADGKASIWAGVIDDLWQMGKPVGEGGPWKNSEVQAGVASDPYLIGFYDQRTLQLSHDSKESVKITIEIDPIGHGPWMKYQTVTVKSGESFNLKFPDTFQSRWIRFVADRDCKASAWLKYE
ncbi:MAG: hypothetical protein WCI31_05050 [Prolixibacteraceae bacterium]